IVTESRSKIEHAVKDIREKDASRETIIEAKKTLETVQQSARKRIEKKKTPIVTSVRSAIEVGGWVKIDNITGTGQIVEIQAGKKKAAVNINGKLLWVSMNTLHAVQIQKEKDTRRVGASVTVDEIVSYKLDLRGLRLDEARDALEKFLDRALLAGLNQIQIIHGKGTGALQKMTHEVLKSTPGIRKFYFENFDRGGTGATIVEL
ncbi:MAG: Smr/MutS family protein, partial [Candidatus Marinimicrobia bacterium]|nr:Smr/MutS family protein [Candidatus Neomarinimicrobiota bacterium]